MKNAIKISIMSGLVTACVLLCGLPHAMAESVPQNNETYYSVNVPSEISLSSDQDETTFTVSGNTYQKRWLDIDITSKNNFNLKNGQASIPYKLDKTKFEYEPQYVDKDSISFSESIKISKNENDVKYSGNYQDQLQFTMNPIETRTIQLDCNGGTVNGKDKVAYTVKNGSSYGQLPVPVRSGYQFVAWKDDKGNTIYSGSQVEADTEKLSCVWSKIICFRGMSFINGQYNNYFENCGKATLYINGKLFTDDPNFLYTDTLKIGDTFKLDNISAQSNYVYTGFKSGSGTDFMYEYYGNGLVKSVSGVVQNSSISLYFNFESDNILQNLIRQYNLTKITIDSSPPSSNVNSSLGSTNLFSNITIQEMDLKGLDTSQIVNPKAMFKNNYYMKNLELSNFMTSSFQSMESLFENCSSLTTLDVTNFDTSHVTNMYHTFSGCTQLKNINIEKWDTSNVKTMEYMFSGCKALQSLDLSNFNTSNCMSLFNMFGGCYALTTLDVSHFDTSKVTRVAWMFQNTYSLKELKGFELWDLSHVKDISWMFTNTGLSEVRFPKAENVVTISDTFNTCSNLVNVDLSKLNLNNVNNWLETFKKCPKLQTIYVADDFSNKSATSQNTFYNCTSLIGGAGTKYDPTFIDSTGARIDGGISNPGYFTAISQKPIETGSVVNIEGSDYIVMGQTKDGNYRLISGTSVGSKQYQPNQDSSGNYYNIGQYNASDEQDKRYDGQDSNTYEDSYIDKFLENTWYTSLSFQMQSAIVAT